MKMDKKKIAVISLVVCLIAILSLGSLAWFTDEDEVTNTFKFESFEVDVYETKYDEATKTYVKNEINGDTVGLTYENVLPGDTVHKDPTVVNKSSNESQWVRVSVTLNNYSVWKEIVNTGTDLTTIFKGYSDSTWERVDDPAIDGTSDTITYTFYLKAKLEPGKEATLFTEIEIPTSITSTQAEAMEDAFEITVEADAVQTSNLPSTITTAKAAFDYIEGK